MARRSAVRGRKRSASMRASGTLLARNGAIAIDHAARRILWPRKNRRRVEILFRRAQVDSRTSEPENHCPARHSLTLPEGRASVFSRASPSKSKNIMLRRVAPPGWEIRIVARSRRHVRLLVREPSVVFQTRSGWTCRAQWQIGGGGRGLMAKAAGGGFFAFCFVCCWKRALARSRPVIVAGGVPIIFGDAGRSTPTVCWSSKRPAQWGTFRRRSTATCGKTGAVSWLGGKGPDGIVGQRSHRRRPYLGGYAKVSA